MLIETLSTFPHMYDSVMGSSMMKRAQDKGIISFRAHDLRDWTHDRHRTTDDDPYGGGAGLVMKCEPIFEAVEDILGVEPRPLGVQPADAAGRGAAGNAADGGMHAELPSSCGPAAGVPACGLYADSSDATVVFLAPQGRRFDDALASELSCREHLLFVCGHYEGIDERVYALADEVISLGDYVLTSGELASMVVIDAVVRKIPGVLGAEEGPVDESFTSGLLEYPQYTRPADFRGAVVPDVLLSGNHAAIARWRREQSLCRTARLRPDLLEAFDRAGCICPADREFLDSLPEGFGI